MFNSPLKGNILVRMRTQVGASNWANAVPSACVDCTTTPQHCSDNCRHGSVIGGDNCYIPCADYVYNSVAFLCATDVQAIEGGYYGSQCFSDYYGGMCKQACGCCGYHYYAVHDPGYALTWSGNCILQSGITRYYIEC